MNGLLATADALGFYWCLALAKNTLPTQQSEEKTSPLQDLTQENVKKIPQEVYTSGPGRLPNPKA